MTTRLQNDKKKEKISKSSAEFVGNSFEKYLMKSCFPDKTPLCDFYKTFQRFFSTSFPKLI